MQPRRTVRELILDLVDRLVEQEEIKHALRRLRGIGPQPRAPRMLDISAEESRGSLLAPTVELRRELAAFLRCDMGRALHRAGSGIVDRANDTCDIPRRRKFHPALGQGP